MSDTPKLKRVHRLDSLRLDEWTDEGFLIDKPKVTCIGVFIYTNPDGSIRKELRLPEHIFDKDSLATYKGKPIIVTHGAGRVDKDNVDDKETMTVGTMLSEGWRDGDDVRVEIVIHNTDMVKRSKLRELSLGYDLDLIEEPGVWEGQEYDAIQTNITVNHLALVKDARAGNQARLNIDNKDKISEKGTKEMSKQTKRKIPNPVAAFRARQKRRLDELEADEFEEDLDIELNEPELEGDEDENTVDPLQLVKDRRDRRDAEGDPETPESAMSVIAQQDEDIETLIKCVEELKAQADMSEQPAPPVVEENDDEDEHEDDEPEIESGGSSGMDITIHLDSKIDNMVSQRLALARIGDRLNLDGLERMKPIDAKKKIIQKVNPSMRLDGKSREYINAAYDLAVDQIGKKDANRQRQQMAMRADSKTHESKAEAAKQRMVERMNGGKQ